MYVYIYIYVYRYISTHNRELHLYTYTYIYIYIHISYMLYIYTYIYTSINVHNRKCISQCTFRKCSRFPTGPSESSHSPLEVQLANAVAQELEDPSAISAGKTQDFHWGHGFNLRKNCYLSQDFYGNGSMIGNCWLMRNC